VELDGVLYCHATPRRDDEMLTRLSSEDRWADALVAAGRRMLAAGWPDERSIGAALVEPVDAIFVTRLFEDLAAG
jgi:hypothetical protein